MWYLKGVLENNLEQMNHRKSRELLYKSYKSKSSEAVNKRDIEPNTKKVEDKFKIKKLLIFLGVNCFMIELGFG